MIFENLPHTKHSLCLCYGVITYFRRISVFVFFNIFFLKLLPSLHHCIKMNRKVVTCATRCDTLPTLYHQIEKRPFK